jgi:tRNA modification GTPase
MAESETITAVATPQGKSALAVIRVSGPDAFEITACCLQEKILFDKTPTRYVRLYLAKNPISKRTIDQITAIKYCAPRSFTGEDTVEIICHGGPLIVKEILAALQQAGARSAVAGEFTRRALLNGKIDLMKAEAIRGLIESTSEVNLRCAQKLYRGGAALDLVQWREELIEQLVKIEAQIEFEEEDNIIAVKEDGKKKIEALMIQLKGDIEKTEKIRGIEYGLRVVIAGPVNAGKSTLFNILVGHNRTIVHKEPGTTRDIINEGLLIHGHDVELIDTAGIRDTEQEVEREGIERSRDAIKNAAIIIWMTAADERYSDKELQEVLSQRDKSILGVINKIDKSEGREKIFKFAKAGIETIAVSLKKKTNVNLLLSIIGKKIEEIYERVEMPHLLFNTRHEEIGRALFKEISTACDEWKRPEIAAYHLRNGISLLDEYFGKIHSDEVINRIFEGFCIGK